jgi:hypothetical protein
MILSAKQLVELLEVIAPDWQTDPDQLQSEVKLVVKKHAFVSLDGEYMPPGLYALDCEYPEEGLYGPLGVDETTSVRLLHLDDDEPWGIFTSGHVDPDQFLGDANALLSSTKFAPVELASVQHVYAVIAPELGEYNLVKCDSDHPEAFKITWVPGEELCYPDPVAG